MVSLNVIGEKPITLVELKKKLEPIKVEENSGFRIKKVKEYLGQFAKLSYNDVMELKSKLEKLEIPRIKDRQIVKIIDLLPKNNDELRMIFAGENTTINQENMEKILEVVKEYVK